MEEWNKPDTAASEFRQFVYEKWYEHKDELLLWEKRLPQYDSTYYFKQHKWFLKNLFRELKKEVDTSTK
jgi:hypothetical protein